MSPTDALNFFDLLGLDPDEPWAEARFEAALKSKQSEWSRNKAMGVGKKKAEAEEGYRLLPTIKAELSDPAKRRIHGDRARSMRAAGRQASAADFETEVRLKAARGFLLGVEAHDLLRKYAPVLGEGAVRLRLADLPIRGATVHEGPVVRPLEPSLAAEIERDLGRLGVRTLYEFLLQDPRPIAQKQPTARLLALAEDVYKQTSNVAVRTTELSLRATLAGHCRQLFGSEQKRTSYDATLRELRYRSVLAKADVAAGLTKALAAPQVALLIEEGDRSGIDSDDTRSRLIEHARQRGWTIELPHADVNDVGRADLNRMRTLLEEALRLVDAAVGRIDQGPHNEAPNATYQVGVEEASAKRPYDANVEVGTPERRPPVIAAIDFGHTNSCIARVSDGASADVIRNREGNAMTPSVVLFEGDNWVVGEEAKNIAFAKPERTAVMVKRALGDPDWAFHYGDRKHSAADIASYILRRVTADAEESTGVAAQHVILTCPTRFTRDQRGALARAGELAGLSVVDIIGEPKAAAIGYGLLEKADQVVLVYALGGGTFDITLIEIRGGNVAIVATGGDDDLGGRQWDERLVQYLAGRWQAESGSVEDPLDSLETTQDLFDRAERGKRALTTRESTDVSVQHEGQRVTVPVTREKFDELTADLLELTIQYTRQLLEQAAALGYGRVDQILFVGGSTRMIQVQRRVATEFSLPQKMFDPDEVVAKGAAMYGATLVRARGIAV